MKYQKIAEIYKVMAEAIKHNDYSILIPYILDIEALKELDFSVKSHNEWKSKTGKVFYSDHNVSRIAMFLLNYYGELSLANAKITIMADELFVTRKGYTHDNTYILKLHDPATHYALTKMDFTNTNGVQDFDTQFVKQITHYEPDKPGVDTTDTAYSPKSGTKNYAKPSRTFDFKSHLWKKEHTHNVDYVIQLVANEDRTQAYYKVYRVENDIKVAEKEIELNLTEDNKVYLDAYIEFMKDFPLFEKITWDEILTKIDNELPF